MWVLKLGGSLLESGQLHAWLGILPALEKAGVLVVPGGGPFADTVRDWQARSRASELTAHRQAILAMQQMAQLYLEHCPLARPWRYELEGPSVLRPGSVWVWLPHPDRPLDHGLEANWRTTSDSLSLALASQVGAKGLLLVKSEAPESGIALWDAGTRPKGLVDAAFSALQQSLATPVWWLGPQAQAQAMALLAHE